MEQMDFLSCINLLDKLKELGVLHQDPNNSDNLIVYKNAGSQGPEGWYSENLMSLAHEVANDPDAQLYLKQELLFAEESAFGKSDNTNDIEL